MSNNTTATTTTTTTTTTTATANNNNNNNTDTSNEEAARAVVTRTDDDDDDDGNDNDDSEISGTTTTTTTSTTTTTTIITISHEEQRRHRRIARYPIGTFLLDSLHLLSPWTWDGLATNRKMFSDSSHHISIFTTTWQSFMALLLPATFYKTFFELKLFLQRRISSPCPDSSARLSSSSSSSSSTSTFFQLLAAFCSRSASSLSLPSPKQLLLAYLLSPWSLAWLLRGVGPVVQTTLAVATARSPHRRTQALPVAWQVLSDAIEAGRAYRTRHYDAYLPAVAGATTTTAASSSTTTTDPPSSCVAPIPALSNTVGSSNDDIQQQKQHQQQQQQPYDSVILFIPGSGLDPTGYATPAKMLSDCGHVVIVVSSEPLRMATPSLGFTAAYGKRLLRQVNRELNSRLRLLQRRSSSFSASSPSRKNQSTRQPPAERTFHLMGHSLGAFTASHWVQELNTTKLILWAAVPAFSEYLNDLRSNNDRSDDDSLQVLVLQASNDGIRQFMIETTTPDVLALREKTFWQRLPQGGARGNVQQRLLIGATHNGFGSHEAGYFLTNPENQAISRLQQQQQAVAWTHEFLVGRQ